MLPVSLPPYAAPGTRSRENLSRIRNKRWIWPGVASLLFVSLLTIEHAHADGKFDILSKLRDTSASTVWRIDQPNVKQPMTSYPQIKFAPGDQISVDAGGCVQRGGFGRTWYRYVNPTGDASNQFYHGQVWIPGVNAKLTRLTDFGLNKDHQIADPLVGGLKPQELFLRLGYEDNDYSDNGYWSHDDGPDDQCKNVANAFLIVSIGHAGALPADPKSFVGIEPNRFRCQAAWAYKNFNTDQLSWSSFTNAFRLGFWDYIDPATYITFLASRGMASSGNCVGMALLSDVGEDQFVVGDLKESFWQSYKAVDNLPSSAVATDVNTSHWKQLSAYFLHNWLGTYFNEPATNAELIEHDLAQANYNYGLISLAQGLSGHALVPLRVSHSGNDILIDVYDPNRPCGSIPDKENYPKIVISGGKWRYNMGGKEGTWSGSNGLAYIPYIGQDGWSDLGTDLAGMAKVIFGSNTTVEQVTDGRGRKLFVAGHPGVIDISPTGLGHSVFRAPMYAQAAGQKRPRAAGPVFSLHQALAETPAVSTELRELESEYGSDYAGSGMVFIVTDTSLTDLTFTISGINATRPVRALIGQRDQFFEIKSVGAASAVVHPSLVIHSLSNLGSAGVTVQSRDTKPIQVTFSHGSVSRQANTVEMQKTAEIAVSAQTKVLIATNNDLEILTAGAASQTQISKHTINTTGASLNAPMRTLMMVPLK